MVQTQAMSCLLQAETAVAFESKAIEIQRSRIQKLHEDGQHSETAEQVLRVLENSLDKLKHDRDVALARVRRCEAIFLDGTKAGD
jgi:hypothetical protein